LCYFFLVFYIGSVYWLRNNWDIDSIDFSTIIFQLKSPLKGTSYKLIWNYLFNTFLIVVLLFVIIYLLDFLIRKFVLWGEHSSLDLHPFYNRVIYIDINGVEYIFHYVYIVFVLSFLMYRSYISLVELNFLHI